MRNTEPARSTRSRRIRSRRATRPSVAQHARPVATGRMSPVSSAEGWLPRRDHQTRLRDGAPHELGPLIASCPGAHVGHPGQQVDDLGAPLRCHLVIEHHELPLSGQVPVDAGEHREAMLHCGLLCGDVLPGRRLDLDRPLRCARPSERGQPRRASPTSSARAAPRERSRRG